MKKKIALVAAVLAGLALGPRGVAAQEATLTEAQRQALAGLSDRLTYLNFEPTAVPSWLMGDLGPISGDPGTAALAVVRSVGDIYRMTADDTFNVRKTETDDIGQVHARLQQTYRGLRVVDGELIVTWSGTRLWASTGTTSPISRWARSPGSRRGTHWRG